MLYKYRHKTEAEHFRFLPPLVPRVSTYSLRVKTAVLALLSLLILISYRLQFVIQQFPFTINLCSAPRLQLADKFLKAKCSNFSVAFRAQPFSADFGKNKAKKRRSSDASGSVFLGFSIFYWSNDP